MKGASTPSGSTPPAGPASVPPQVGPYRILRRLGQGRMGAIFLADDTRLARKVALKFILSPEPAQVVVERFNTERQVLAALEHPSIARIYDAGTDGAGLPYFAMEYIPGEPLSAFADAQNLDVRERLALFLQVCDGITYAHRRGVLHRDLKPANVLALRHKGQPTAKVIDFGLAKIIGDGAQSAQMTADGQRLGTPAYMSPEQARAQAILDVRTDVYSLGVILYELLAGIRPFEGKKEEVMRQLREEEPPTMAERFAAHKDKVEAVAASRRMKPRALQRLLESDLAAIPMTAIEREAGERYADVPALAEDVRRWLAGEPLLAARGGWGYAARKFARRHAAAVAIVSVAGVAVAMATGAGLYGLAQMAALSSRISSLEADLDHERQAVAGKSQETGAAELARKQLQTQVALLDGQLKAAFNAQTAAQKRLADLEVTLNAERGHARSLLRAAGLEVAAKADLADPRLAHRAAETMFARLGEEGMRALLERVSLNDGEPLTALDAMLAMCALDVAQEQGAIDAKLADAVAQRCLNLTSRGTDDPARGRVRLMAQVYDAVARRDIARAKAAMTALSAEPVPLMFERQIGQLARLLNDNGSHEVPLAVIRPLGEVDGALRYERGIAELGSGLDAAAAKTLANVMPGDAGWRPLPARIDASRLLAQEKSTLRLLAAWTSNGINADAFADALATSAAEGSIEGLRLTQLRSAHVAALATRDDRDGIVRVARSVDEQLTNDASRRLLIGGLAMIRAPLNEVHGRLLAKAVEAPADLRAFRSARRPPEASNQETFATFCERVRSDLDAGRATMADMTRLVRRAAAGEWDPSAATTRERQTMVAACRSTLLQPPASPQLIDVALGELAAAYVAEARAMAAQSGDK